MARPIPIDKPEENGALRECDLSGPGITATLEEDKALDETPPPLNLLPWEDHLPAENPEQSKPLALQDTTDSKTSAASDPPLSEVDRLSALCAQNAELREKVEVLEKLLEEAADAQRNWAEKEKEYESLIEEKSEVIRELHLKSQENRPAAAAPREEELLALGEELERERLQLKHDEEALMAQMRGMELQMSRERAELARQRVDLQRLHNEIHHELELASREAQLRDRLLPLQRRHHEMLQRKGAEPTRETSTRTPAAADAAAPAPASASRSGLLRRIFG